MSSITISERDNKPTEIAVKSTIPLLCIGNNNCAVIVNLVQQQNDEHITLSHCHVKFSGNNNSQIQTVKIIPKIKKILDGDKNIQIKIIITKREGNIAPEWMDHLVIANIKV